MILKPVTSEKAVRIIELDNTILFEAPRNSNKKDIKSEVESQFNVKVEKIRTLIHKNKKFAYVKLNRTNPAIDIATKLGMI
jgi:large subunit ribosomal protein L23